MAKRILGLDLGTNSIGWGVVDEAQEKIVDVGVRIFPEGVVGKTIGSGDKEETKNATRRKHRQIRRQFYRKRLRKAKLLEVLIEQGMCPLSIEELNQWRRWDKNKKTKGRKFPDSDEFMKWIHLNPYELRERAITATVTELELGRIFYHLVQRRGFLSSRKGDVKESETLFNKGKPEINILPINKTIQEMGKNDQTLGQYLKTVVPEEGKPYVMKCDDDGNEIRARGRYATRQMYLEEFEAIWNAQAQRLGLDKRTVVYKKTRRLQGGVDSTRNQKRFDVLKKEYGERRVCFETRGKHAFLITTRDLPLRAFLAGDDEARLKSSESVLFWQRPLRSQKGSIGYCSFENGLPVIRMDGSVRRDKEGKPVTSSKRPCPISHPAFELFRAHQFINNIRFGNGQRLSEKQREDVLGLINKKSADFKFKEIVKKLELFSEAFNYENDFKVSGNYTISKLSKLLGKVWEESPINIWHCFYTYDDTGKLCEKLEQSFGVTVDFKKVDAVRLKEGYSRVSLKAINNILPFLEKGLFYSTAVILGGVKNTFGSRWEYLEDETIDKLQSGILAILKGDNRSGEAIERVKRYLSDPQNRYAFSEDAPAFGKLYHHSQPLEKREQKSKLQAVENIRNPIVQQALYEMRNVVNSLLLKYREDDPDFEFDSIHVEMGRDLKNGKQQRQKLAQVIKDNNQKNDEARERLSEYGLRASRDNVHKYLLFREMETRSGRAQSPYTGQTIPLSSLLGTGNTVQIEHIMPYSKSLNDSFANKTLCEAEVNGQKGDETPFEFYQRNPVSKLWNASSWDEVKRRAFELLPYPKAKRFTSEKAVDAGEFVSRQLNDSRYIAKKAAEVLSEICADVQVMPGQLTAELRHLWGLNNILEKSIGADNLLKKLTSEETGEYYLVLDKDGRAVSLAPKKNPRPSTEANEMMFAGEVNDQVFKSKHLILKLDASKEQNGKYWAKLVFKSGYRLSPKYIERPSADEDRIIFKGRVKNQRFSSDSIPVKPMAEHDDGLYWACFGVKSKRVERSSVAPKTTRKEIKLWGQVKSGVFESYIYKCLTNADDGKYWLILEPDFETPEFVQATSSEPPHSGNEIVVQGTVDEAGLFVSDLDPEYSVATDQDAGKYHAVVEVVTNQPEFHLMENPAPEIPKEHRLVEGTVWLDKFSSELKFDPKKNREDQRHHAIDAITIALTKQRYLNELSRYRSKEHPEEFKPVFPEPWEGFEHDVKSASEKILISYRKDDRVVGKGKKGTSVRGQLHKENVFGEYVNSDTGGVSYHRRKSLAELKTHKHVGKIVDPTIKPLVLSHLRDNCGVNTASEKGFKIPVDAFFKDGKPRLFLSPNPKRKVAAQPVPIKKVRVREELGNARQLKGGVNQHVNPRNNHHVMIYRDSAGELKESIVSFWDVVNREKTHQPKYQLPQDGVSIVLVLEENSMFLLGVSASELMERKNDQGFLSEHLYRVQKISAGDYSFRHHLASAVTNSDEEIRVGSFKAFEQFNPIKTKVSKLGEVTIC